MEFAEERNTTAKSNLPTEFALYSPYPNPFNAVVNFSYALPAASEVQFGVYDLAGRLVAKLMSGHQEAGVYRAVWNGESAAAGLYFLRLQAGSTVETKRMVLVK